MQHVFVLDHERMPLSPCHSARARQMLRDGKAAVYRRYPFTIILKERIGGDTQPLQIKFDPGSKTTGVALVQENKSGLVVVWGAEITHRGKVIKEKIDARKLFRRGRRDRNTRYREMRGWNRKRGMNKGWIPPSIRSRVDNIINWFVRLDRLSPIRSIGYELVKFDMQKMKNAEISGVEYQQGELQGYEVREYLLEKWKRKCSYCGKMGCPLEIEHVVPRSRGGSNRVSNLVLACEGCNKKKGTKTAAEFGYPEIHNLAKAPLRDAGVINQIRWVIYERLKGIGLPIEVGSGAQTKFNRTIQGYPKAHWIDASCVGKSGESIFIPTDLKPLLIKAMGRGHRQMQRVNKFGFPCAKPRERIKRRSGYQTGDIVRCVIGGKKYAGIYTARIAECGKGNQFAVRRLDDPKAPKMHLTNPNKMKIIQMSDGYSYSF